jgi:membrane associated rhomboid family serine protease
LTDLSLVVFYEGTTAAEIIFDSEKFRILYGSHIYIVNDRRRHIMSLIKCPECGAQISDEVYYCPQCGYQNLLEKCNRQLRSMWSAIVVRAKRMHFIWLYAAMCLVTTLICMSNNKIMSNLAIDGGHFELAKIHTLVSYSLAHGGITNWFFNMLILVIAGLILEPRLGSLKTMFVLLAGILATSISYALFGSVPMISSTGAVYSVIGGIIAIWITNTVILNSIEKLTTILLTIHLFINLAFSYLNSTWVPVFGFLAGFLLVFIMNRKGQLKLNEI